MIKRNISAIIIVSSALLMSAFFFEFASASLVPCGPTSLGFDQECNTCQLFQLAQNIIKFVSVDVAPALAIFMLVVGGILMITSGGSEKNYEKGKTVITSAIIGILIIWLAWLIINTILTKVAPGVSGTWYEIECK